MKQSPLHSHHQALGAEMSAVEDWEIPLHYGNPIAEHLTVRNGVGISDLSNRGKIEVTGEDRVKWLQSIISNDLLPLQSGQGLYSSFMTHKGKMLSYFRVYLQENAIVIEDAGEIGDTTFQTFRKFLLYGTKAKMNNLLESWGIILLSGRESPKILSTALGVDVTSLPILSTIPHQIGDIQVLLARTEETGELDFEIFVPKSGLPAIWEKIWDVGNSMDLKPFGTAARQSLRIEAGLPQAGPDLNEEIVPPEANLEGRAFSLNKGCYPGQEVVARMDTYGSVKRRLVGLTVDSPEGSLPQKGARLFSGDRDVGWVSSASYSPVLKKNLALGFPLRDFTKPETELTVDIQGQRHPAVVHTLPFISITP